MTLKERLNAEESKVGKFLKKEITLILAICTALGGANEYIILFPTEWIPMWIKMLIPISGLISYVAGRLTVKKPDEK